MAVATFDFAPGAEILKALAFMSLLFAAIAYHKYDLKFFRTSPLTSNKLFWLIAALFVIAYLRTNNYSVSSYYGVQKSFHLVLFVLLTIAFYQNILGSGNKLTDDSTYMSILVIPATFIFISLVCYILSVDIFNNNSNDLTYGNSVTAKKLLGLNLIRKGSALSLGMNGYGLFVGGLLSMSLVGLWSLKKTSNKVKLGVICFICMISLIYVDTRSAMIWSFISATTACGLVKYKKIQLAKPMVVFIAIVFPLMILSSNSLLNSALLSGVSRSSNDISTGNGRLTIWSACWREISKVKPIHIIGYGEYGQTGSKISQDFDKLFADAKNADLLSTHNLMFQLFIDSGYIGVVCFFIFLFDVVSRIKRIYAINNDKNLAMFVSFILYTMFVGGTEANLTHKLSFHFCWIIWVGVIVMDSYYRKGVRVNLMVS